MNNLTAKEKAKELVYKYFSGDDLLYEDLTWIQAKQCALIAIDEILIEIRKIYDIYTEINIINIYQYWQEVKQEIEKL